MKVYVINMKRSAARRAAVEKQLQDSELPYEIVDAVDGRQMSDEAFDELIRDAGTFASKSQAGCMLSHIKAYETMLQSNDEYALILEDDILITEPKIKQLLEQIASSVKDGIIMLLTYYWCREGHLLLKKKQNIDGLKSGKQSYGIYNPEDIHGVGRAAAYILTKQTAQSILDFQLPKLVCQADSWIVYKNQKVIDGVQCIYPMPISENTQFGSEIGYTKGALQKAGKKLVDIALNMNMPIISGIIKRKRMNFALGYKNIKTVNDK